MLLLSSSLVVSHLALLGGCAPPAHAARGLDRYIRRKSLDPLETYVPLVLEARALLAKAKEVAAQDVGAARELLRSGPYSGLRDNIRAIGEYAARDGRTTEVGPLVTGFFKALEDYDQLLLAALRDKTPVEADKLDACISDLYAAFDKLIATVPADVLERAQKVLDVTMAKAAVRQAEEPAPAAEGKGGAAAVDQEAAELLQLLR
ncbi:hypothetical protein HYH02_003909 [Chlamydomonas schloesseri]|uniref:DUF7880 domain-containing protein n=1 Tax=Chlamydomonas schloesseri TaxID=2026947 RepID=A0A835WNX1_9CHLO|nr:hypothetical protein HYH02_003909 [Chlamydomonas schloesseri]|eukprot:KAG2451303.1 hypothetical protein HYH02_003909 [Chlamydomonas schloesseri]